MSGKIGAIEFPQSLEEFAAAFGEAGLLQQQLSASTAPQQSYVEMLRTMRELQSKRRAEADEGAAYVVGYIAGWLQRERFEEPDG
jgi:hypothetical protein